MVKWQQFTAWLQVEPQWRRAIALALLAAMVDLSYNINLVTLMKILSLALPTSEGTGKIESLTWITLYLVLGVGLLEELIFRFIPLFLVTVNRGMFSIDFIIACAAISSITFGYIHGNWGNVAFQGVGGMFYSLIFLKCGGLHRRYGKALVCSTLAHTFYNGMILLLAELSKLWSR